MHTFMKLQPLKIVWNIKCQINFSWVHCAGSMRGYIHTCIKAIARLLFVHNAWKTMRHLETCNPHGTRSSGSGLRSNYHDNYNWADGITLRRKFCLNSSFSVHYHNTHGLMRAKRFQLQFAWFEKFLTGWGFLPKQIDPNRPHAKIKPLVDPVPVTSYYKSEQQWKPHRTRRSAVGVGHVLGLFWENRRPDEVGQMFVGQKPTIVPNVRCSRRNALVRPSMWLRIVLLVWLVN